MTPPKFPNFPAKNSKVTVFVIHHPAPASWQPIGLPSLESHSSARQLIFPPNTLNSPTF